MSENICIRCGKPCAQGETMCSDCCKWLEDKQKSAPVKSFLKKPVTRPAPTSKSEPAKPRPAAGERDEQAPAAYSEPEARSGDEGGFLPDEDFEDEAVNAAEMDEPETPEPPKERRAKARVPFPVSGKAAQAAAKAKSTVSGAAKSMPGFAAGAKSSGKPSKKLIIGGAGAALIVLILLIAVIPKGKKSEAAHETSTPAIGWSQSGNAQTQPTDSAYYYSGYTSTDSPTAADTDSDPYTAQSVSISLFDMAPWNSSSGGFSYYTYGRDNKSNEYDNSIGGYFEDTDNWCEYWLDGEYTEISGIVYLNYDNRNEEAKYTKLTIYGDDELLFTSSIITKGLVPQKFSVDLTGVEILRINIYGNEFLRLSDCFLSTEGGASYTERDASLDDSGGLFSFYTGSLSGYEQVYFSDAYASSEINNKGKVYWATNAIDGDLTTSWQEDADEDGIGEYLMLSFDTPVRVDMLRLRLGYATYYERNGRPKQLLFEFSDGTSGTCDFDDANKDFYIQPNKEIVTDYILITITQVYTGSQWTDTCITEVTCYGEDAQAEAYYGSGYEGYVNINDIAGTYSVQCGSFVKEDYALSFADSTIQSGDALGESWNVYLAVKNGYYAVFIGPYDNQSDADTAAEQFNSLGNSAITVLNKAQ